MLKKDLVKNNPLRILSPAPGKDSPDCSMGVVISRAGLGKTAVLVQIALDAIFRGNKVLHVSIGEGLDKAKVWYDDLFHEIIKGQSVENVTDLGDDIRKNRMIMTFKESAFSRPKLEERLNDLVYQNIFRPDCVVIDGLDFAGADRAALEDIRELMTAMNLHVWFTALSHRDDQRASKNGVPAPCHEMEDLFETVILLQPQDGGINLRIIKDDVGSAGAGRVLPLDTATMIVTEGK